MLPLSDTLFTRVEAHGGAGGDAEVEHAGADGAADLADLGVALPHVGARLALAVQNPVAQVGALRQPRQGLRGWEAGRASGVAQSAALRSGPAAAGRRQGPHVAKLADGAFQVVVQRVDVVVGRREGVHEAVRAHRVPAAREAKSPLGGRRQRQRRGQRSITGG